MITVQYLMSEHFSDSISNRSARPEKNTLHKKYITRLEGYNNTDQLCDRESLPTDLPESWPYKELLHNRPGLINQGDKIIPVTHKESYILSRPLKAMAQWKIQYIRKEVHTLSRPRKFQHKTQKEVYILSRPRKFQHETQKEVYILSRSRFKHMPKEVYLLSGPSELQPVADYVTRCTHREKDLPQLHQDTHREPATAGSQALITSYKLRVDQCRMVIIPRVYRRTRSMLKIRCTNIRQTRHNYSQPAELEKAKLQTPFTSNEARNYVEHNSVEKISDDLVHPTKSDTASASLLLCCSTAVV